MKVSPLFSNAIVATLSLALLCLSVSCIFPERGYRGGGGGYHRGPEFHSYQR